MKNEMELYIWGGTKKIKSFSPFCMKALYAARLKGIKPNTSYVTMKMPSWAKKGTLPVAVIKNQYVEDSSSILTKLDELYPDLPSLYPSDENLKLETKFLEDWADEYFVGFGVVYRWKPEENFNKFVKDAFGRMPWILKKLVLPKIRKETLGAFCGRTVGEATDSERLELYKNAIKMVNYRLGKKPFLIYDQITAADLAVFSPLEQMYWISEIPDLVKVINQYPTILDWMNRMKAALSV